MAVSREAVAAALFDRLQSKLGANFVTYSRAYIDPNELQAEHQPALIQIADNYYSNTERGRPNVWVMKMILIIYARAKEMDITPETQMNALLELVESALDRQPTEAITDFSNPTDTNLGGLVSRVSVAGTIDIIPGEAGGQAAAVIPVEILVPPQVG
jgi:hypothetical protein